MTTAAPIMTMPFSTGDDIRMEAARGGERANIGGDSRTKKCRTDDE
jgi:hypothetical protein